MPLQWIWKYLNARTIEFVKQLVANSPCKPSGKALRQRCVPSFPAEQRIAMMWTGSGVFTGQEGCTDLYAFRSKSEGREDASGIGDASSCDYRQ